MTEPTDDPHNPDDDDAVPVRRGSLLTLAGILLAVVALVWERVRNAVTAWHQAINPGGWSGDSCFTGGCGRAFHANGCGGMTKGQLVF